MNGLSNYSIEVQNGLNETDNFFSSSEEQKSSFEEQDQVNLDFNRSQGDLEKSEPIVREFGTMIDPNMLQ